MLGLLTATALALEPIPVGDALQLHLGATERVVWGRVQNPGFGDERGDNLLFRPPPFDFGDVGLVDGSEVDGVFDISRSLLTYSSALPVGSRYGVVPTKGDHAVVGVSWIQPFAGSLQVVGSVEE